jgi:PAS domain S-box-containing protein
MKDYDDAYAKYYSKLKVLPLPLTCWEFRKNIYSDAFLFKKIQSEWCIQKDFLKQSKKENKELLITDKDFKIVFASNTISKLSGYQAEEILGKSPSMFQGKKTCNVTRQKIKTAIINLIPFKEVILNYRKNGEKYWCEIEAYPMFDKNGTFLNYIALERIAA